MEHFLSFRPSIHQLSNNFSHLFEKIEEIPLVVTEIIVTIATFQEEGTKHVPVVFLGDDLNQILTTVNGTDPIFVGEGPISPLSVHKAFKACGPLGQGRQWAVFFLIMNNQLKFGLFRTEHFPLKATSFESLRASNNSNLKILGFTRIGETVVEVCSADGNSYFLDASGKVNITQNPLNIINQFVSAVSRDVPASMKDQIEIFYHRIAIEIFSNSHGTLAVVTDSDFDIPYYLSDGIWLKESFDLTKCVERYLNFRDENSTLSLVALGHLIQNMMKMDGVTIFNSSGRVLGYNCFVKDPALLGTGTPSVSGGARRRAFEVLTSKIGSELIGTLYKSQDGMGDCHIKL
jgi:hypothetical protein